MNLLIFIICIIPTIVFSYFLGRNNGESIQEKKFAKEKKEFNNYRIKASAEVEFKLNRAIEFYGKYTDNPEGFCQISNNGAIAALISLKNELGLPLTAEENKTLNPAFSSVNI